MPDRIKAGLAAMAWMFGRLVLGVLRKSLFAPLVSERVRHVVVYRVGNIGDTVVAVPALQAIRQSFPGAVLTLVTSAGDAQLPGAVEVLAPFPALVDHFVVYRPSEIKSLSGLRSLKARVLAAGPVDLFVDLPLTAQTLRRGLQTLFLARWLSSRSATGFDLPMPEVFRTAFARVYPQRIPQTYVWLLSLVKRELGAADRPFRIEMDTDIDWTELGLALDRPILAVNAGAKLAIKRWPATAFSETINRLLAVQPEWQVVLLGSAQERELNDAIAGDLADGIAAYNLAGRLDLRQTWVLLAHVAAVLTNDTGTMHMAGLLSRPVYAAMSGQYPAPLWHPPGETLTALRHAVPCAPCFADTCPLPEQLCLTRIQPAQMAEAIADRQARMGGSGE